VSVETIGAKFNELDSDRQINVLSDQLMRIDALHPAWVEEVWIAG
jgi:hypothetical protein